MITINFDIVRKILRDAFAEVLLQTDPGRAFSKIPAVIDEIRAWGEKQSRGRVIVVSLGKIGLVMADELISRCVLHSPIGLIAMPGLNMQQKHELHLFAGGHPLPNITSQAAAEHALQILKSASKDDLVVFLISGGGSAALETPLLNSMTLADMVVLHDNLVQCGANIVEINTIRKHLSGVKGGRLALAAAPARQISIIISDVPNGELASVASGPTMPDDSSLKQMKEIIEIYNLAASLPESLSRLIAADEIPETPKFDSDIFQNSEWHCLLSNDDALQAAVEFYSKPGWISIIVNEADDMEVKQAADYLLDRLRKVKAEHPNQIVCVIAGGEVRSQVRGKGKGGRNQAFVLAVAACIADENIAVLSCGTDGIDGKSTAAGAIADGQTCTRAAIAGLDIKTFFDRSDANTFFRLLGDEVVTGPTGNNLCDLRILVAW